MTRTFIQTSEFSRNWDKLGLDDNDMRRLELILLKNPKEGKVISGTGKLRKLRFAFEHSGKSSSARVCYVDYVLYDTIYLITVYSKKEKENLTPRERNDIKKSIAMLEKNLEQGGAVMTKLYDSIMAGLSEAIDDAKSVNKKLTRRTVTVVPVKTYNADEVRTIRKTTGFSQRLFASYLGVSIKTVEAWEAGINQPSGAASRLLTMMEMDHNLIKNFPFVVEDR